MSVAASRLGGVRAGLVAASLFLPASVAGASGPNLWNPSIGPLPHALLALALVEMVPARVGWAVVAGLAFGLCVDANLSSASLALPLLLYVFFASERPAVLSALIFGSAIGVVSLLSPEMVRLNLAFVLTLRGRWVLAATLATMPLLGAWLRGRAHPRGEVERVVGGLTVFASLGLTGAWLVAPLVHLRAEGRYAAPYLVLGAIVLPTWLQRGGTMLALARRLREALVLAWLDALVVLGSALALAAGAFDQQRVCQSASCPNWSLDDTHAIGRALAARGWSAGELRQHLRAPSSHALLSALSVFAPSSGPSVAPQTDLQLFLLGPEAASAVGANWERVPLRAGALAVFRPLQSYVDRSWLRACFTPEGEGARPAPFCVEQASPLAPHSADAVPGYQGIPGLDHLRHEHLGRGAPYVLRYELPLRTPADGSSHVVETLDDACDGAPWTIERVEGMAFEWTVAGRSVRLAGSAGAVGRIVLAKRFDEGRRIWDRSWLPDLVETYAGEAALREALARDACR